MLPNTVIAIDGPAASGKSSVAKALARRLGYVYVNTGAMYRAATLLAVRAGVDTADANAVTALLNNGHLQFGVENGASNILLDGTDPSPTLADAAVNANVSAVASIVEVRRILVARQREYALTHAVVMEGRDIGSAVFPQTPYKFYVDASPEVRAQRRAKQGHQDDLVARDKIDSSRKASPLLIPEGSTVVDSSFLTVEGVVEAILTHLKQLDFPIPE
jgi:cytidylate kinase